MSNSDVDLGVNPLEDIDSEAAIAYQEQRNDNIRSFVRTNSDYYIRNFDKIGASAKFTATFNFMAGLFGPIWFGARGLWSWALPFLILEAVGFVQIARGLFGDLANDAMQRIASIEGTLELRRKQLAAALESGSDKVDVYRRTVESLEANIGGIRDEAAAMAAEGPMIALAGLTLLIAVKLVQSIVANWALEGRFSEWLSDGEIRSGMPVSHIVFSAIFMVTLVATAMVHYSFPGSFSVLGSFPTDPDIRLFSIDSVEAFFNWAVLNGDALFDAITYFIRVVLDTLELVFVSTPWIVIAALIILLTLAHGWGAYGDLFRCVLILHGPAWILGKSDDHLSAARHCGMFVNLDWHPFGNVRSSAPSVLFFHSADYGFHANYAGLCLYDPGYCFFWDRKACGRGHHHDFWGHAGGASDGLGTAWRSRECQRGCN
jgi:glycine betaine/proline transport system permease protein